MKRALLALALAAPLVLGLGVGACAATLTVDGYEATWVDRPAVDRGHRWVYHGATVYEVDGRYYREHEGRWVVYRERPRELVEERR
jgi:hypothetical protein